MNINFLSLKNLIVGILILNILNACQQNKPAENKPISVNPFDTTQTATQMLSDEDRTKLATAAGKKAQPTTEDALTEKINKSTGKLHVYCFWDVQNAVSASTVKAIKQFADGAEGQNIQVTYIHAAANVKPDDVNLFIRENQLTDETLLLNNADLTVFMKKIKKDLEPIATLPLIIMVNKADGILQVYNKPMDENELAALIHPLL